jgi:hypothetical protein
VAWIVKSAGTLACPLWLDRQRDLSTNREDAAPFVAGPDAQDALERLKQSRTTGPLVFYIVDAESRP